jgi:Smg protein
MYEILVYLFEHCQQADLAQDSELVAKKLSAAGFEDTEITEALSWLAGVLNVPHRNFAPIPDSRDTFRAFAPRELEKLNTECRGFILSLEQSGILTPQTREHVIERALAATEPSLSLEQLKLVVLMVLWNQQTPASRLVAEELLMVHRERLPS